MTTNINLYHIIANDGSIHPVLGETAVFKLPNDRTIAVRGPRNSLYHMYSYHYGYDYSCDCEHSDYNRGSEVLITIESNKNSEESILITDPPEKTTLDFAKHMDLIYKNINWDYERVVEFKLPERMCLHLVEQNEYTYRMYVQDNNVICVL
jgi:hypothetical protein